MKILLISTNYHSNIVGGGQRSVQFLAESLMDKGHEVVVVSACPERAGRVDVVNGVKVYRLGLVNLYWPFGEKKKPSLLKPFWHLIDIYNPWMAHKVGRILDNIRPDCVHTNIITGFSVAVWREVKERKLPLVHTLRDNYLLCARTSMYRNGVNCKAQCWACRPYALPKKKAVGWTDAVVGNSQFILDRHLGLGYFARTSLRRVIYNAYEPKGKLHRTCRDSGPLRLGYLGRFHPSKGVEFLLQTLAHLSKGGWGLWIGGCGTVEYETYLKSHFASPNVHYLGFVRPEHLFAKIDALVVPSLLHDTLARTIFEAYAHGVPVIGSNRGGTPEIIDEGKTGFIFDPDEPGSLDAAIIRFLDEPELACRMRPAVLAKAREFLPERIVSAYLQVYEATVQAVK